MSGGSLVGCHRSRGRRFGGWVRGKDAIAGLAEVVGVGGSVWGGLGRGARGQVDGSAVVPVGGNCPHARGCPAHRERVIGSDAVWIRSVACTLRSVCWVYVFIRLSV